MSEPEGLDREALQARIRKAPFHEWLGLEVLEAGPDGITVKAPWRPEFVVNVEGGYTHGGILATLVDLVADWALAAKLGRPFPTVDVRVDYHRPAKRGDLIVKGRIVRAGGTFATAEAAVEDAEGRLVASGRGTYYTGAGK